ncbi:uncharacterized protein DUF4123 [Paraburkholderia eburnea]|uniref:Uncharacterized protein DUF4123 n=1 Tax=Paraburkholderia eburnea TaxID=1189126 RepID=A0A2S4MG30_9BURK|nr:DUF4123 domain-containing protein [Paraburkholderia eburnea]POR53589.1 uncharacterized protein DUF4123 [Paraburkholderia eburnea]PRZ25557.1 uncharacterized protein DUF4123 [Paraburkholderia eburnea]
MNSLPSSGRLDVGTQPQARYALVNAAQVSRSQWVDLAYLPVVPERFCHQPELFPVLVDFQPLGPDGRADVWSRDRVSEQENGVPFVLAFFDATVEGSAVTAHLVRRMAVRRPDGVDDALRFYDPFVFQHLLWLLSVGQMDSLLGPITTWHWRQPDGTWHQHVRVSEQASLRPLRLTSPQWLTLLRMAEINRALVELSRVDPACAGKPGIAQQLDMLLAEASDVRGLGDPQDRLLYVLQASRYHRHIHQHPVLRNCLGQVRENAMTFVTACADIDDSRMCRLAKELEQIQVR